MKSRVKIWLHGLYKDLSLMLLNVASLRDGERASRRGDPTYNIRFCAVQDSVRVSWKSWIDQPLIQRTYRRGIDRALVDPYIFNVTTTVIVCFPSQKCILKATKEEIISLLKLLLSKIIRQIYRSNIHAQRKSYNRIATTE